MPDELDSLADLKTSTEILLHVISTLCPPPPTLNIIKGGRGRASSD